MRGQAAQRDHVIAHETVCRAGEQRVRGLLWAFGIDSYRLPSGDLITNATRADIRRAADVLINVEACGELLDAADVLIGLATALQDRRRAGSAAAVRNLGGKALNRTGKTRC